MQACSNVQLKHQNAGLQIGKQIRQPRSTLTKKAEHYKFWRYTILKRLTDHINTNIIIQFHFFKKFKTKKKASTSLMVSYQKINHLL